MNDSDRTHRPDAMRRRLLRVGGGALALPLLQACGSSSPGAADPVQPPGGDAQPPPAEPPPPPPEPPPPPPPPASHPPRGLHVSFTDDPESTRTLSWFTDGSEAPASVLEYGPVEPGMSEADIQSAPLPSRVEATAAAVFEVEALCHSATARGLPAGTSIRYRVGSDEGGWSAVKVLPATPQASFRFCHYGDQGVTEAAQAVVAGVSQRNPDFLLIAGDLSYANGEQPVWDHYFDMIEPVASRLPVMTTPGNHEANDGGGAAYDSRLRQPGRNTYYGFDYKNIHFFCSTAGCLLQDLSSAGALAAEILAMEADLAAAAQRRANGEIDFIVVAQHYTIWTNEDGRDPANLSLVALEEHILLRYGVDLLLVAHDHIYERSKPMAYGRAVDDGYVQITQGGGGKSMYELLANPADWSAFNTLRYGFTEYVVDGPVIRGTSYAVDRADNSLPADGALEIIDQFELSARSAAARSRFALPVRAKSEVLGRDWNAVTRHTYIRNGLHDALETGAVAGSRM